MHVCWKQAHAELVHDTAVFAAQVMPRVPSRRGQWEHSALRIHAVKRRLGAGSHACQGPSWSAALPDLRNTGKGWTGTVAGGGRLAPTTSTLLTLHRHMPFTARVRA